MKVILKFLFFIYVSSFYLNLIQCTQSSYYTSLKFLESNDILQSGIDNVGIKCFWLEPNTMSVFDLKNLKRPIFQK